MKLLNDTSKNGFGGQFASASLLALILLVSSARSAHAQVYYIGPDSGNWNTPANWGPLGGPASVGVPIAGDDVILGQFSPSRHGDGPITVTLNTNYTNVLHSLTLDAQNADSVTLVQNNSSFHMNATTEIIGYSSIANEYDQSAGVNGVNSLTIGALHGSSGSYMLSGNSSTSFFTNGSAIIGDAGSGTFIQSGTTASSISNGNLILGNQAGSTANYDLQGGTLAVTGNEYVGYGNRASTSDIADIDVTGGSNGAVLIDVGTQAGSAGTYELSNAATVFSYNEIIGDAGTGTFTQSGTSSNTLESSSTVILEGVTAPSSAGNLTVGSQAGSNGAYKLEGGALLANGNETIGDAGTGTFTQSGTSTNTIKGNLTLGNAESFISESGSVPGGIGAYNLQSGTLTVNGNEVVGNAGAGTFTQSGSSSHTIDGNLTLGSQAATHLLLGAIAGSGTFNLQGGTLLVQFGSSETIGDAGSGTFNQSGTSASSVTDGAFIVGNQTGSHGAYNLQDSSQLAVGGNEIIGQSGSATFTQSGSSSNTLQFLDDPIDEEPYFPDLPSGNLAVGVYAGSHAQYNLQGGTLTTLSEFVGVNNSLANGNVADFNQTGGTNNITGEPGLDKLDLGLDSGSIGTYELSGDNTSALNAFAEIIGDSGTGTFTQSGSAVNTLTSDLTLGNATGAHGTYNLQNGTLRVGGNETIGNAGAGTFTQGGSSSHTVTGNLTLGSLGSSGTFNLQGGTLLVQYKGSETIGDTGTGTFTQSGSANNFINDGALIVGSQTGSHAAYTLQDSAQLIVGGNEVIGQSGSATFTQSGSSTNTTQFLLDPVVEQPYFPDIPSGNLAVGVYTGSNAQYNLESGTLTTLAEYMGLNNSLSHGDKANFNQTGGTNNLTVSAGFGKLDLGYKSGSIGTYELSGDNTSALNADTEIIGDGGTGTFTQSGSSSNTLNADLTLGNVAGASGIYKLQGGTLQVGGTEYVGNSGTGTFNQTGGTNSTGNVQVAAESTYSLNGGGTLSATGTITNNGHFTVSNVTTTVTGNVINNGTIKTTNATVTWDGTFINNGGYHSDPSTQNFTQGLVIGANGYLQGGAGDVFNVTSDVANSSTQNTLFNISQATLSFTTGNHTVGWTSVDLGVASAGYLNNYAIGTLDLQSGAVLTLNSPLYVTNFDIGLDGGLTQLSEDVIDTAGVNIYYDPNAAENAYLGGLTYSIGDDGGMLEAVVPEPSTYVLLLVGAGILRLARQRRGYSLKTALVLPAE
jgi:fibronectin-binding autotransporter adhesin